ncbi:dna-damage repair [Trichoderma arundinaceum]|uniref:Dna-damage repair n=1 Tax=Trichoderma arundinaceum TaxID=490622 RepID=A0A395NIR0_TRIAR|nr:dna-damage repair [Trichoderma arundinaceum]
MAAPPPRGLSLYDNLHDPNDPSPSATISSAPVTYNQGGSAADEQAPKKPINPALQFQPIRRPQVKQPKAKPTFPKAIPKTTVSATTTTAPGASQPVPHQSTLADWAATEEDEWMYGVGEKRQRGGRKKKKKRQEQFETDWDEMYDPSRPTNVDEFLRSDEKVEEVREWKGLLYRHRKRQEESDISDSEDEGARAAPPNQFAPPASYAFAPPPRSPPAAPPQDETADEAYARRLALSTGQQPPPPPQPHPSEPSLPAPPPPPPETDRDSSYQPPPPPSESATISKAPVRYTQATQSPNNAENDEHEGYSPPPSFSRADGEGAPEDSYEQRSNRPGQAGFAQRLMSKYGWTKGSALGANESGILNPLRVQVEKRRKKADADGGGWAEPGGKGKIIGGKRKEENGKFGVMSEVIVLQNMLENMPDLEEEIADGLGQEIGGECGEKYGRVERLYIDVPTRQVFIKFTNQVSALRAVNELDGRVFNGNSIIPKFYDTEKFEKGIYVDATN